MRHVATLHNRIFVKTVNILVFLAAWYAPASFAQKSCHNNLDCSAGMICNAKKQCEPKPGANGGGGTASGPFSTPTEVTGTQVLQAGLSCLNSLRKPAGCDKIPDQQTLTQLANDASKACLGSIKGSVNGGQMPPNVQAAFKQCVDAAMDKALTNLLHQTASLCLPIIKQIKSCINASVLTLGHGFNELWCKTYPQDDFCTGGRPVNEQVNNTIINQCLDKSGPVSNSECFSCCMRAHECENYRNKFIGEVKKAFCQGVENSCNKCNLR